MKLKIILFVALYVSSSVSYAQLPIAAIGCLPAGNASDIGISDINNDGKQHVILRPKGWS